MGGLIAAVLLAAEGVAAAPASTPPLKRASDGHGPNAAAIAGGTVAGVSAVALAILRLCVLAKKTCLRDPKSKPRRQGALAQQQDEENESEKPGSELRASASIAKSDSEVSTPRADLLNGAVRLNDTPTVPEVPEPVPQAPEEGDADIYTTPRQPSTAYLPASSFPPVLPWIVERRLSQQRLSNPASPVESVSGAGGEYASRSVSAIISPSSWSLHPIPSSPRTPPESVYSKTRSAVTPPADAAISGYASAYGAGGGSSGVGTSASSSTSSVSIGQFTVPHVTSGGATMWLPGAGAGPSSLCVDDHTEQIRSRTTSAAALEPPPPRSRTPSVQSASVAGARSTSPSVLPPRSPSLSMRRSMSNMHTPPALHQVSLAAPKLRAKLEPVAASSAMTAAGTGASTTSPLTPLLAFPDVPKRTGHGALQAEGVLRESPRRAVFQTPTPSTPPPLSAVGASIMSHASLESSGTATPTSPVFTAPESPLSPHMPPSPSHQSQQSHRSHQSHHSHFSLTSTEESVYASALPSPMFTNAHMANVLAADGSPYMVPPSVTFPGQTVEHLAEHRGKVEDQDPKLTLSPPSGSPTRPDSSCTGIMGARCSCSECN